MANAGEVFSAYENGLADEGTLDVQPAEGGEAVVHNIWYGGAVEIYRNDGTNTVKVNEDSSSGIMEWLAYHVTNSEYITIKNVSGGAVDVGYDGIYTKATS
jgi:hypothetical protein